MVLEIENLTRPERGRLHVIAGEGNTIAQRHTQRVLRRSLRHRAGRTHVVVRIHLAGRIEDALLLRLPSGKHLGQQEPRAEILWLNRNIDVPVHGAALQPPGKCCDHQS